jgi:hypothetical protein
LTTVFVMTLDQRRSGESRDLVEDWAETLSDDFAAGLRLPFARTAGDEMQAVVKAPGALVDLALRATRSQEWWVGIGLGEIDKPLGETARDSRGPAFVSARAAVDAAKRRAWGCAVRGEPELLATRLEDCLALLVFLRRTRSPRAWQLVDLASEGLRATEIARQLGITKQAASQQLRAAGFVDEGRGRDLAVSLLNGTWTPPS